MDLQSLRRITKRTASGLRESFPALNHKNFRYFWFGQCVSLIGTWMQNAGQSWLVLQITNNAFLLGLLNAMQFMPMLVFSLFAGVIVDRFPKRKVVIIAQLGLMVCAFALAALIWTNHAKYIYILIIAVFLGIFQSIDMPARQTFMVELVGRDDLLNAVALNSSIFNGARIIGPAIAGIVIGWLGAGAAFFINGLSFLAVIYGLLKITVNGESHIESVQGNIARNVADGIKYIGKTHILFVVILVTGLVNIFCLNFNTLIPVFAMYSIKLNAQGYGALMSAMGAGALVGAVSLAARSGGGPQLNKFMAGGIVFSVFMVLVGLQKIYWLSAVLLAACGWGMVTFSASANSLLQLNSPDDMRGRIMSVYSLVTGGFTLFGSLYSGYMAKKFDANIAFWVSGIIGIAIMILAALMFKEKGERKRS